MESAQLQLDAEIARDLQARENAEELNRLAKANASLKRKLDRALQAAATENEPPRRSARPDSVDDSRTARSGTAPARASDSLPPDSALYRAIQGRQRKSRAAKPTRAPMARPSPGDSSNDSSDTSSSDEDVFSPSKQPLPDKPGDSPEVLAEKQLARATHRAKLDRLKIQMSFLKPVLPEIYKGEADAEAFEKFSDQMHDYAKMAYLDSKQAIKIASSRCSGKAYNFYESEVRRGKKKLELSEFLKGMFDYIFPANFRTSQRILFEGLYPKRDQKSVDFIRKLQTVARSAGDITDREIVRHFWRHGNGRVVAKLIAGKLDEHTAKLRTVLDEVVTAEQILERESSAYAHERK